MGSRIDGDRVIAMAKAGCSIGIICKRLKISESSVRRALRGSDVEYRPNTMIGSDLEWLLWENAREFRMSPSQIAYRFGYSYEYMRQYFNNPRQVSGFPD